MRARGGKAILLPLLERIQQPFQSANRFSPIPRFVRKMPQLDGLKLPAFEEAQPFPEYLGFHRDRLHPQLHPINPTSKDNADHRMKYNQRSYPHCYVDPGHQPHQAS
jgi:hypothetical protein